MARALYRSRQVMHALAPRIDEGELAQARKLLSEAEAGLFLSMERRDQCHALAVLRRLRVESEERPLLVAALLHDCGKGRVPVWLRIAKVMAPWWLEWAAKPGDQGWRVAAYRLREHAEIGATKAEAAGCEARTVRLIRGRVEPDEAWMYALLCRADDAS